MRLYFPVDLTGNLIMIEKLVLGEIWTEDFPICNPDTLTSAPSWQGGTSTGSQSIIDCNSSWIPSHATLELIKLRSTRLRNSVNDILARCNLGSSVNLDPDLGFSFSDGTFWMQMFLHHRCGISFYLTI